MRQDAGTGRDAAVRDAALDGGVREAPPRALTDDASAQDAESGMVGVSPADDGMSTVSIGLGVACAGRSRPGLDTPLPAFQKQVLVAQPGAAYLLPRDLSGDGYPELLLTSLSEGLDLSQLAAGPPLAAGGAYVLERKGPSAPGTLGSFVARTVFDRSANVAWPNESTLFDVDNDGVEDWLIGAGFLVKPIGALVWMKGERGGNFGAVRRIPVQDASCWYHKALPMDVDRDGDLDFVTSCHVGTRNDGLGESRIEWFENPGDASGAYTQHALASGGGALLSAFDVDDDGLEDIIAPQFFEGESLVWFQQTGLDARFVKHVIDDSTGRGFIVRIADVDGDGRDDLVYGNHNNEVAEDPTERTMGIYWFTRPTRDVVHELSDWRAYRHTVFEGFEVAGDGNGSAAGAPGMLNVGDLDGDCDYDITASGDGDTGLYVFLQGASGFTPRALDVDPSNLNAGEQHVLDLDEDGDMDIVWAVFGPNDPALLLTTGLSSKVYAFQNTSTP